MNDYYSVSGSPATGSQGASSTIRAEYALIAAAFDKLPSFSGNGGKIIAVNSGATALEAVTTTGTGNAVRATSPTLVTPLLGTPTSGTLTNCTGLPVTGIASLTASAAELNILDGVTASTAEINILDGAACVAADLAAMGSGSISYEAGWATVAGHTDIVRKSIDGFVNLQLKAEISGVGGGQVGTLVAGYRPSSDVYVPGFWIDDGTSYSAIFRISSAGVVTRFDTSPFIAIGGDVTVVICGDFPTR